MKNALLIIALILIVSYGCGTQTVDVEDSLHTVGGTTTSEIIIKFEPLIKINELCNDLFIESEFVTEQLYKQKVAECTFEKLSIINFDSLSDFNNELCDTNEAYNALTPEEQLQVDQLCEVL